MPLSSLPRPSTREGRSPRELTLRSLILVGVMGAIAIGGTIFAVRRALAPIGRLEAAIRQRDPLDLTLVSVPAPRELAPFVTEINHFIERLRGRVELMQQFMADAAHQLQDAAGSLERAGRPALQ